MEIIWEMGATSDLLAKEVFSEMTFEEQEPAWVKGSSFRHLAPSLLSSGTPKGVDFTAVRDLLLSVEGVEALHSLHIWALTVAQPVLSVHIAIGEWWCAQGRRREGGIQSPGASLTGPDNPRCLQSPCFELGPMLSALHTLLHLIITILFIGGKLRLGVGWCSKVICPGFYS